ncbi:MAG TPA: hypothetical protein VFD82_13575 [Planctomycetota bacterium]|nr:hypothetical protein [Planctomycetota bacterium]
MACPRPLGTRTLPLLVFCCTTAHLPAQTRLDREISFVRALARDMSLELARSESDRLAAEFRSAGDQDKIALLAIEISYHGARTRSDRNQQRTLYREAIAGSKELIARSSDVAVQTAARTTLANASREFGQVLVEALDVARVESPERGKELEDEASLVFAAGIEACSKVMERLRPPRKDPQQETEYYLMWLRRGVLARERARAVVAERSVLLPKAIDDLTSLVLEAGEETAIGLRGMFEIAQCNEVAGKILDALRSYRTTIDQIATSLQAARTRELDLTQEMQRFLFEMMQEVYARAGQLMVHEGSAGTGELFAAFRANMKLFGEQDKDLFEVASEQHGHLVLLAESRFLAASGNQAKVSQALAMARRIHDRHRGDHVGEKARALLRGMIETHASLVSGGLLLELGKGALEHQDYELAVTDLRRCIAVLDDSEPATRLAAWQLLGAAHSASGRHREAMLALCEGLEQLGSSNQERAGEAANELERAVANHKRQVGADPSFEPDHARAAALIARYSATGGSMQCWKTANALFNDGKFREAIAEYAKIESGFLHYEQARVLIARAWSATGDFDVARRTLAEYRAWVADNPLPASDTSRLQVRRAAAAEAAFAEVQMSYVEARGSAELQRKQDLTKYPAALENARAYIADAGKDGEANLATVLEYIGRLHADLAELDRAEEAWAQLKTKDAARASRLAACIFQEYQSQVKTLGVELDNVIANDQDEAAVDAATQALNAMRTRLVAIGSDYIASSPKPQLAILIATMQGYEALDNWPRVEEIARKTIDLHGAATNRAIEQFVRPKIGEALLQQRHFQQAYDLLVEAERANPDNFEVKRLVCRALGGWFEFSKTGANTRVAGLDRPADAYRKYYTEYRVWGDRPEVSMYSLAWYRFQWEAYWFARQAGLADSKFKEIADKFYRIARSTDDFAKLKTYGREGRLLFRFFQSNR